MRLQSRIGELHLETDEERLNLKEMYKERVRLNKDKEVHSYFILNDSYRLLFIMINIHMCT